MQLEPFPYHLAIADRLERAEPDLWQWFQTEHIGDRYQELTRADLQRRARRLPRDGAHEMRYALVDVVRDRLGVAAPAHLYRLQETAPSPAAFLVLVPDEVLIVLADTMLDVLDGEAEWLAAMGREIARFRLYQAQHGRVHIAAGLLRWLVRQTNCPAELIETARRFRLTTEAYCDLGGFRACDDRAATVRVLFKSSPNAGTEGAETYLKLTDGTGEDSSAISTTGPSELAARAIALTKATARATLDPTAMAESLVSNPIDLGALDLLDQETLRTLTRAVLDRVLSEPAGGTPRVLDHAREMFPAYTPQPLAKPLERPSRALAANAIDYLAYLLLDLATVEGTRLREAIAVAAAAADELDIGARFREIARQELRGRRGLQAGLARRAA